MRVGVVVLLLSSVVIPLTAATRTWTGTTDGNWMTATNWGGTAPVAGDDLVFPAAGANQATTNNFPALTLFNYTLNGNAITLGAGGIVTTGGTTHSRNGADDRKHGKRPQRLGRPNQWNRQHYTQQQ